MKVDLAKGLLDAVNYRSSPHFNERPVTEINMIVIHGISLPPGEFGGDVIQKFFCGQLEKTDASWYEAIQNLQVSSHLLIKRDGSVIQFVPFHKRAWHAGVSSFQGMTNCNDFSIGIELEGTDYLPYEENQYQALATIVYSLQTVYPEITRERIVGHSDIAPGRKTDPGPHFDWAYFDCLLTKCSA